MSLFAKMKNNFNRRGKSGTIRKRIAFSYISVILIGTILFASGLTMKGGQPMSLSNAFFTSTSAFADSGLNVIDYTQLNIFGHITTLVLLEFGGFGVMAFKILFFVFLGQKVNVADRLFISTEQHQNSPSGIIKLMKMSGIIFFLSQIILAIFFAIDLQLAHGYSFTDSIGYGVYHSVSTINSAGFDIFPNSEGMSMFKTDYVAQMLTIFGLFLGGIGFPSLYELYLAKKSKKKKKHFRFSLYFKVNLTTYIVVFVLGFIAVMFSERNGVLAQHPNTEGFFYILFQTFSYRSAGFQTIALENFNTASHFIFMILMFIGVGPASTGGGIRTTTVGVIFLCFISFMKGKDNTEVFNRTLTKKTIFNAFMVLAFAIVIVTIATLSILLQSDKFTFFNAFYEAISAFGTIGTTLGMTEQLNTVNKIIIAVLMIIGRLGIIGTLLLFTSRRYDSALIKTPEEHITIG